MLGTLCLSACALRLLTFPKVVGEAERSTRSVNVRNRDDAGNKTRQDVTMPIDTLVEKLRHMKKTYKLENRFD